jgi:hypothetical protein
MTTQESPPSQDENAAGPAATDVLFDSFLVAMKPLWRVMGREVTSCGGKQSGQVNGLTFTRANILEHTDSGADVQGNMYVGRDGPTIIILFAFDAMSHFDESAKLGSAAIQTFRKKQ